MGFDVIAAQAQLDSAFKNNSEIELLKVLKANSFLLYGLYTRKFGIQPSFAEVPFGTQLRCDFCWLNDNSDGPEWVLVEIEAPEMRLFNLNGDPSAALNHAIEQVKSWERYFCQQPAEKQRIFGAVAKFRYILIGGRRSDWQVKEAAQWRTFHNQTNNIEIHSADIFYDAISLYKEHSDVFWSFEDNPVALPSRELVKNWNQYDYIRTWRNLLA